MSTLLEMKRGSYHNVCQISLILMFAEKIRRLKVFH